MNKVEGRGEGMRDTRYEQRDTRYAERGEAYLAIAGGEEKKAHL